MKTVDLTQLTSAFMGMRTLAGAWGNGCNVSCPSTSVNWRKLLTGIAIWLAAEICLSSLGFDELADYGEFLFDRRATVLLQDFNEMGFGAEFSYLALAGSEMDSPKF